ncbi:unnamed protein product [Penicillium bialowiezense]
MLFKYELLSLVLLSTVFAAVAQPTEPSDAVESDSPADLPIEDLATPDSQDERNPTQLDEGQEPAMGWTGRIEHLIASSLVWFTGSNAGYMSGNGGLTAPTMGAVLRISIDVPGVVVQVLPGVNSLETSKVTAQV